MDFNKDIDLDELSERINHLRNLEAQEDAPGPIDEYLNMDKLTIIKMLLASQKENKMLHDRLDQHDEEARAREKRLTDRIDSLMAHQIELMDNQAALNREMKKLNATNHDLLIRLKEQQDMIELFRKEKFASKSQKSKRNNHDDGPKNDGQRGDRVQQKEDFNGDPDTLKDSCNDVAESENPKEKVKEKRDYRKGMRYNKGIDTKVYHHGCDLSKLPEGCVVIGRKTKRLKCVKLLMTVHEYEFVSVRYPDGHIELLYFPKDAKEEDCLDDEFISHAEYRPFGNTGLTVDSIPTLAYLRYGLSTPANRLSEMLKEAGLGGCRQSIINWLKLGSGQLSYILPALKARLLCKGTNVNCDETWTRLRRQYHDGYKKVYVWVMVNKKEKIAYYFFDHPEEGTRSREVLKQFLGDAKIKSLQSDGYVGDVFLDDDLTDVEHIYCLAHVRAKLMVAYEIGKVKEAKILIDYISKLYALEKFYKENDYSPKQICEGRNSEETNLIVNNLKAELDRLWPKDDKQKQAELDPVFATALRYLYNQWDGLMNYRKDGEYSIDNNIAERNVRPATVERKNSLSFASEDGIERSATYHTIVQTCRMMGTKVLKYLQTFFEKFNEGCRDFANMIPGKLAMD